MLIKLPLYIVCSTLTILYSQRALSQAIEVIQPINFGHVVIIDNHSVGVMDIDERGDFRTSDHFRIITPGHAGIVELRDFALSSEMFVSGYVLQSRASSGIASPETFTLTQVNIANSIYTRGDGSAEVKFGAQLSTSGSGSQQFADTTFTMRVKLVFQY